MTAFVDEVTAHEVAHQYWGHMVGWKTFHDQWLSEGFANFSAGLYLQNTERQPKKYLDYWEQSRKRILAKNSYGRQPNDAGPLWLGIRLNSFKNPDGYSALVYDKGGYVLHMLRLLMFDQKEGDKYFIEMMQDFVQQHLNRNATTESFQRTVEKHMRPALNLTGDGKLDWFFSQWVYGSSIPRYKLDYELTAQPEGKWLLQGSITQSEVPQNFMMGVPLYADFDGVIMKLGAVRLTGAASAPVKIVLPKKPKRVMLNAFHDVLEQ
jgi:aminopeptidase N